MYEKKQKYVKEIIDLISSSVILGNYYTTPIFIEIS